MKGERILSVSIKTGIPDIFFLPEWAEAYESQDDGVAVLFEFSHSLGRIHYPFIKRMVPGITGYFDTITPFGLNGPLITECQAGREKELAAAFDQAFQQYCTDNRIIAEYIRFNPWVGNIEHFGEFYGIDKRGIAMYVDLTSGDYFMDEFKSGTRQQVRRAMKNEVTIEYDFTGETLDDFCRIYELMAKRNSIPDYYLFSRDFLADSFHKLAGKQFIINALHEGKRISTALMVHHGDYLHYHLAANDPAYFKFAANSLVLSEACRWGTDNGKKQMHLGGASTEPLYRFKRGFTKTEPLDILTGKKIRNDAVYEKLVRTKIAADAETNTAHFPIYRG